MTIDLKVEEAAINLALAKREHRDPRLVQAHFSAFLTSARSVIQYVSHACEKSNKSRWYHQQIRRFKTFEFFKKLRNTNVHEAIVIPGCRLRVSQPAFTRAIGVLSMEMRDSQGNVIDSHREPVQWHVPNEAPSVEVTYQLQYRGQPVELFALCERYLDQVKAFVDLAKRDKVV